MVHTIPANDVPLQPATTEPTRTRRIGCTSSQHANAQIVARSSLTGKMVMTTANRAAPRYNCVIAVIRDWNLDKAATMHRRASQALFGRGEIQSASNRHNQPAAPDVAPLGQLDRSAEPEVDSGALRLTAVCAVLQGIIAL